MSIKKEIYFKIISFIGIFNIILFLYISTYNFTDNNNKTNDDEPKTLQEYENRQNNDQTIRNFNFLKHTLQSESKLTGSFLVIVVQVHNRIDYLKYVVESLRNVKYIEETLLIFSHDYYLPEIDKIVDSIDFCATLRIYYPFSERPSQNAYMMKNDSIRPEWLNNKRRNGESHIKHHFLWKVCFLK